MRFHWQNLNERHGRMTDIDGRRIKNTGAPTEGRCWLHFGDAVGHRDAVIKFAWHLFKLDYRISLSVDRNDGQGFSFSLAIPLLGAFYLSLHGFRPLVWLALKLLPEWTNDGGRRRDYGDREISCYVHDWAMWWNVWQDRMGGWSNRTPWWRHGSFHVLDFVLGRHAYTSRALSAQDVLIPMPERSYKAHVTLTEDSWKRPRWPFTKYRRRAHIESKDDPIPFPGKGENSYDCGEDASYGLTTPAATVSEAIAAQVGSVMRNRERRGGVDWRPEAVRKAAMS